MTLIITRSFYSFPTALIRLDSDYLAGSLRHLADDPRLATDHFGRYLLESVSILVVKSAQSSRFLQESGLGTLLKGKVEGGLAD